jgi:sterol 24-C-methyltransferase
MVQPTVRDYSGFHDDGSDRNERKSHYASMVNKYYDLSTDFYEYGWGDCFHFAHRFTRETLKQSLVRHEHYLALKMGLGSDDRVLDVGCGIGGPLRNIARFSGASVTGLNNNTYQVARSRKLLQAAGLTGQCDVVPGDFMTLPFPDESFDASYAIESTCHAPEREGVFAEVFRVLQPGGRFCGYEWCLTEQFDGTRPDHQAIKGGIERGNALPDLVQTHAVDHALEQVGFELVETEDRAATTAETIPWFAPLSGQEWNVASLGRMPLGRTVTHGLLRALEGCRLLPQGASATHALLCDAAHWLVEGGRQGIFTPMYFFSARKPPIAT